MGYRSDVGLALTKDGVETLRRRLASPEIGQELRECIEEFLEHADKHARDRENGHEAWYWDYLKWYTEDPENYPEVDFIETLIAELNTKDFCFIRVGEDYDDTDVRGCFWENSFNMELMRGISFLAAV